MLYAYLNKVFGNPEINFLVQHITAKLTQYTILELCFFLIQLFEPFRLC